MQPGLKHATPVYALIGTLKVWNALTLGLSMSTPGCQRMTNHEILDRLERAQLNILCITNERLHQDWTNR